MMDDALARSEQKARRDKDRSQEAARILESSLWTEAWAKIDGGLIDLWKASRVQADREELWRYCQITRKLRACFEDTIKGGEFAEAKLRELTEQKDFASRLQRKLRLSS